MKITNKHEDKLITFLQKGSVSIPEVQYKMKISYRDARGLVEYAINHKWIAEYTDGIDFPTIESSFTRKDLPENVCKQTYKTLNRNDLRVLGYIGSKFSATIKEIIENLLDDEEDAEISLDKLVDLKLIFKIEEYYYCKISNESIAQIKKSEESKQHTTHFDFKKYLEEKG